MIHVDTLPVDVNDMRDWANGYKTMHGLSWQKMGDAMGIPAGTIQPFCKGNYAGRNDDIARKIFLFKQGVQNRDDQLLRLPVDPGYFETPTSLRIRELLAVASSGKITVGAFGPGLGKTLTAKDFLGRVSPVWMVTMDEVSKKTGAMIRTVEQGIGLKTSKNWPSLISAEIISYLRKRKATIIIDEANHLELGALEQLRAWHDATGVGICLLGNEELIARIESGPKRDQFGRLKRRISRSVVQNMPLEEDVTCFCEAWEIFDPTIRATLMDVAMQPGSGGLGECAMVVTDAVTIAGESGGHMEIAHVRWAIEQRQIRIIR